MIQTVSTNSKRYQNALNHFRKQFKDVVTITKIFINKDNQVYAGEWLDSKNVVNFNAGYAGDVAKTIVFK